MALLISVALFFTLTAAVTLYGYARYVRPALIIDRLAQPEERDEASNGASNGMGDLSKTSLVTEFLKAVGAFLPLDGSERNVVRKQLSSAGIRSDSAIPIFAGCKVVGAGVFLVIGLLVRDHVTTAPLMRLFIILAACGFGYFLPGLVVGRMISARQESIRMGLPDALDLLVVCTDAGCALDQAILNVSRELRIVHPALCDELSLVNFEIRAGSPRADALRNLGERTGEEELKKFVSVLIQTDRFGTSISDALRTQAEYLRTRRRQSAEERAGKVGVKLVFPIFFFCLPSLLIVTAGPGILQMIKTFSHMNIR